MPSVSRHTKPSRLMNKRYNPRMSKTETKAVENFRRLLKRYDRAHEDYVYAGSLPPEEQEEIHTHYWTMRRHLKVWIRQYIRATYGSQTTSPSSKTIVEHNQTLKSVTEFTD